MIRQSIHTELLKRLKEKRRFVQVSALIWPIPVLERTSASPIGANETMKWTLFCNRGKRPLPLSEKRSMRIFFMAVVR